MDNTFDANYISQDEIDNLLDDNYILTEFKKTDNLTEIVGEPTKIFQNQWNNKLVNRLKKNNLRPCERTYHFQDMVFTPEYINELASRNGLLWLLEERKQLHNVIFTNDEIYSLIEAICDNWKKYLENS